MIVDEGSRSIMEFIPLTRPTGKFRVKRRSGPYEYGEPFSSRQSLFTLDNYVEWQISYDTERQIEAPSNCAPVAYDRGGKKKFLAELSFYLYKFYMWGIIRRDDLIDLGKCLRSVKPEQLVANHEHCHITRTRPHAVNINDIPFSMMTLKYPQLVYDFDESKIIAEITIREKQRAIGIQPMLYFCIPISELKVDIPLIGRTAERNEVAHFEFSEMNYRVVFEMVKVFGILSISHQEDILSIIRKLLDIRDY